MEYILAAKPIKVHGAVVASYGSENHPPTLTDGLAILEVFLC